MGFEIQEQVSSSYSKTNPKVVVGVKVNEKTDPDAIATPGLIHIIPPPGMKTEARKKDGK